MTEAAVASYGRTKIPYRIARSRRRVSVAVVVDPVDGVILRAPPDLEHGTLDLLVRRKGAWIVRQLRSFEDLLPAPSKREFVSGESFWYLGRQLRLRVEVGKPAVAVELGTLVVRVAARADVRAALRAWYRRRAALYLPARVREVGRRGPSAPDPRASEALGLLRLGRKRAAQLARDPGRAPAHRLRRRTRARAPGAPAARRGLLEPAGDGHAGRRGAAREAQKGGSEGRVVAVPEPEPARAVWEHTDGN
jgi:hypothetical protein